MHSKLHRVQFICLEISKGCSHMSGFKFDGTTEVSVLHNIKLLSC